MQSIQVARLWSIVSCLGALSAITAEATTPPLFINEFMTSNASTVADEFGEFDGWLELHNCAPTAVDLSGMYLTDDLADPTLWRIPDGTTIAAGGFRLFWADGHPEQGDAHTNFELTADGDVIVLVAADGLTRIDAHGFGPQTPDVSEGRVRDGSGPWTAFDESTPGVSNRGSNMPPTITDTHHEPQDPTPTDEVTVTCTVHDDGAASDVIIFLDVGQGAVPIEMSDGDPCRDGQPGDDVYAVVIPPFPAGTRVDYAIVAVDDDGAVSVDPLPSVEVHSFVVSSAPPVITDARHEPQYPTSQEQVNVTCTVHDDAAVTAVFIFLDIGQGALPFNLFDDGNHGDGGDGDGNWGLFIPPLPDGTRLDYVIIAADGEGLVAIDPPGAPDASHAYVVGFQPPPLYVNEVMVWNDSTIADEFGEFDDWVEMYNGGGVAIGLGGMHLTDDLSVPTKWRIPAGVTIEAGGSLLFWADTDTWQGPTHTNFDLGAGDEEVALFDEIGTFRIDGLVLDEHVADASLGRLPDGGETLRTFDTPTPGASNWTDASPLIIDSRHDPQYPTVDDLVTVTCRVTDDSAVTVVFIFPDIGQGSAPFEMFDDGAHGDGAPADGVWGVIIPRLPDGTRLDYRIVAGDDEGLVTVDPPGASADAYYYVVGAPKLTDCGMTASASSIEGTGPLHHPWNAVDGLQPTRWSSHNADDQWIQFAYNDERTFNGLTIHWGDAYAVNYTVFVSDDGALWTPVFTTIKGNGGVDEILCGPQVAHFLRVHCALRATELGNSIREIEIWSDDLCRVDQRDVEERVDELVGAMTLEEKTSLVHGETVMSLRAIPRLGIPALRLSDGPVGARADGPATAFPAAIALAATWDTHLALQFGEAIGKELRNKGRQVWLGPGMNVIRVPQCGRNFEYYSEDPFLASRMAVASINGAQSQGIVACPKHFVANNQEQDRTLIDVQVDERTLREIYLPAFEASVREAGAGAIMAAFNRVNGVYSADSALLLTDILKTEWEFDGFVVSDWGATYDTIAPANAGLDLEMDACSSVAVNWGDGQLADAVRNGLVAEARVDDMARRILRATVSTGIMDEAWDSPNVEIVEHRALVREIAADAVVLLKNDNAVLPLDRSTPRTIAVLGTRYAEVEHGGGSSQVTPYYTVSPLAGLENVAGPNVTFVDTPGALPHDAFAAVDSSFLAPPTGIGNGLLGEYFDNMYLQGTPVLTRVDQTVGFDWDSGSPAAGVGAGPFSVRWTGVLAVPHTANWDLGMATDDGFRLHLDGELIIDAWRDHLARLRQETVYLEAGRAYDLKLEYYEKSGDATATLVCEDNAQVLSEAVALAENADAAVVFVGLTSAEESEGFDRPTIDLTLAETNLIKSVSAANPATVVVVVAGSQVGFDAWIDDVPAVVQAWYGGQEAGNAIADVLFGDVTPGAKLPMTFVRKWEDHPAFGLYPNGVYADRLDVGYRYFDRVPIDPMFPFGHGLSYTTFAYTSLVVDTSSVPIDGVVIVAFDVENTGSVAGSEVAQLYVRDVAASVVRPYKELRGFAKVALAVGERETVMIGLDQRAFSYYDVDGARWHAEPGAFEILVGSSSTDLRMTASVSYP